MTIQQYISKIDTLFKTGDAREHSYRGDLQNLLSTILPDVLVINEKAGIDCGTPDLVLTRKNIDIAYIEAKDITIDLTSKNNKTQFDKYKSALSNLAFTNYLEFHFYNYHEFVTSIAIAKIENGKIVPIPENFEQFTQLIINFAQVISQTIKSPTKLAQLMAGNAKFMASIIENALNNDDAIGFRSNIKNQMLSFQQMLIHDIDNKSFADIYAQTIAYGMFAARYHDPTLPTFSREEAATLIPKSNPFLRKLFQDIAGYDIDKRLLVPVNALVNIFLASDVAEIMKNFGKSTKQEDPVVHFYETFLGEYNPALRKARGVWYTPQPVVNFIVRAVDDILKTEFNLKEGLADTSKIKIKKKAVTQTKGKDAKLKEVATEIEVHKVQILDPATGTGTFLAETVKHIYKKFEGQQGIWSHYVTNDLIPRLNGFELLMASYAMAHLKMDMLLTETGYKPQDDQRFRIFLTNSLEEATEQQIDLFTLLADEANQANAIKRDAPVMVVMGNPPYSVSSSNKSDWIRDLTADYKKDLKERNIQPLSDDYIKFIRFGQHFIDKNGSGILAYISNNSFIDGIIHRQMRKHLLESFDKIYILDLHGNAKKKEVSPDGSIDQNVFDIMQGVSINIFVKTNKKKPTELGEIFHYDLQGKRDFKYAFLNENSLKSLKWNELINNDSNFYFILKNYNNEIEYKSGFSTNDLFLIGSSGVKTERDSLVIQFTENELEKITNELKNSNTNDFRKNHSISIDGRDWKLEFAKLDLINNNHTLMKIHYRPFDYRFTYYTGKTKGFQAYPRKEVSSNFVNNENYGLIHLRQNNSNEEFVSLITNVMTEKGSLVCGNYYISPLYLYPETTTQQSLLEEIVRTPNLNMEIVNEIAKKLEIPFVAEKETLAYETFAKVSNFGKGETEENFGKSELKENFCKGKTETKNFAPIDILDYIYAVLHSPSYREKYKEFLKIDFPRVPYPESLTKFETLAKLGSQLRQIHLLESPIVDKYITQYLGDGDNVVTKPIFISQPLPKFETLAKVAGFETLARVKKQNFGKVEVGNVYINETQYFANVPEIAWNFYIGGYQPAQKWLKDRKDRELSYDDIKHYQKIIVALTETDRLMKEIDSV